MRRCCGTLRILFHHRMTNKHRAIPLAGRCDTTHRQCRDIRTVCEKSRDVVIESFAVTFANAAKLPRMIWSCCYRSRRIAREKRRLGQRAKESRHAPARRDMHGWNSRVRVSVHYVSRAVWRSSSAGQGFSSWHETGSASRSSDRSAERAVGRSRSEKRGGDLAVIPAVSHVGQKRAEARVHPSVGPSVRRSVDRSIVACVRVLVGLDPRNAACEGARNAIVARRVSIVEPRGRLEFSRP